MKLKININLYKELNEQFKEKGNKKIINPLLKKEKIIF